MQRPAPSLPAKTAFPAREGLFLSFGAKRQYSTQTCVFVPTCRLAPGGFFRYNGGSARACRTQNAKRKRRAGPCTGTPFPEKKKRERGVDEKSSASQRTWPRVPVPGCPLRNTYIIPGSCDKIMTKLSTFYERTEKMSKNPKIPHPNYEQIGRAHV